MSAQTIIHSSIGSIRQELQKNFLKNADAYILNKSFALGEGYSYYSQADSSILYDILQSNDCEILTLVKKEIERIEDAEPKKVKKYSEEIVEKANQNLYELWLSRGNRGSKDEFLDLILKDEELKLENTDW